MLLEAALPKEVEKNMLGATGRLRCNAEHILGQCFWESNWGGAGSGRRKDVGPCHGISVCSLNLGTNVWFFPCLSLDLSGRPLGHFLTLMDAPTQGGALKL